MPEIKIDLEKLCKNIKVTGDKGRYEFPLRYEVSGDKVNFWYETKSGRFEPQSIAINHFIPIDKATLNVFGLFQAEGTKANCTVFDICNSNPMLIKLVVDYFQHAWCIPKDKWKCEVFYWKGKINSDIENDLKCFWSNLLQVSIGQIKVRQGTFYRLSEKSKSIYGVMSLRLPNKTFRTIVLQFLSYVKRLAEVNAQFASYYLQGLFSGDGTVVLTGNSLEYVGIAFNPKTDELSHYKKVLEILNIKPNESSVEHLERKCIQITGWENFYNILKATNCEPFLQNDKNLKFWMGFINNQYLKTTLRLKIFQNKWFTAKDYESNFNVVNRTAYKSLKRLVKIGILKKEFGKFILSKEGILFLNTLCLIQNKIRVKEILEFGSGESYVYQIPDSGHSWTSV